MSSCGIDENCTIFLHNFLKQLLDCLVDWLFVCADKKQETPHLPSSTNQPLQVKFYPSFEFKTILLFQVSICLKLGSDCQVVTKNKLFKYQHQAEMHHKVAEPLHPNLKVES